MSATDVTKLQEMATKHLWLHFTAMQDLPPERLADHHARRRPVRLRPVRPPRARLPERPLHRPDRLLARRGAGRGDARAGEGAAVLHELDVRAPALDRAGRQAGRADARPTSSARFFVSSGSEAVESAIKLARDYHAANGEPMRRKVIARKIAYHGTTYGALSLTGITGIRTPVRAADGRRPPRREHEPVPLQVLRRSGRLHAAVRRRGGRGDRVRGSGDGLDGDHGAGAERRRVVHAASRLPPARQRDLPRVRRAARRRRGHLRLRPAR